MMPTKLTPDKIAILKEKFSNTRTKDLALELGVSHHTVTGVAGKLGIKKSEEYLKLYAGRLKEGNQAKTFFPKGHKPWNAGTKGLTGANTGSFKKGQKPHNALDDWQEVFYTDSNGKKYLKIKVPGVKVSVFKHIYLWEQHHQKKVPKNYLIRFKDGDTLNLDMDNLECITRKENMLKNSIHNLPAELKETILLVKNLNNKIKKHERANS
jgi:hypothetical protein